MKKLSPRQWLIIAILCMDAILFGLFSTNFKKQPAFDKRISDSSIKRICELATYDCFYHNVTEWSSPGTLGFGKKKLWLEYDGVVRVGVKADQIKISKPDEENVITVTIPQASVLGKDLKEDSIYEIDSSSPMWGFIPLYSSTNTEERKTALAKAQDDMEASAAQNVMILQEAQERAKMIIEKNLVTLGEASGTHYNVEFIDLSDDQGTDLSEGVMEEA